MSEKDAKVDSIIQVKYPTHLKDLKPGDIVITAELHEVKEIEGRDCISVTDIGEPFPHVMSLGWGQHCILKVIGGVIKTKRTGKTKNETDM